MAEGSLLVSMITRVLQKWHIDHSSISSDRGGNRTRCLTAQPTNQRKEGRVAGLATRPRGLNTVVFKVGGDEAPLVVGIDADRNANPSLHY